MGKNRLAEKIVELIEKYYPDITITSLRSASDEVKYDLFRSLFSEKLDPKEIKEEIIQKVIEELENRNVLESEFISQHNRKKIYDGIPISALQNLSPEEKIEIEIKKPWGDLGMYNQKTLRIKGNVGDFLGNKMIGGKIVVEGDAEDYTGYYMCDGELWINGNTGNVLGNYLRGGRIVVNGKAGKKIGYRMGGGEIWVKELNLENLSFPEEMGVGKIYRGLPGEDFELVSILEILKKSENKWIFFYFDKREEGKDFLDRAVDALTRIFLGHKNANHNIEDTIYFQYF